MPNNGSESTEAGMVRAVRFTPNGKQKELRLDPDCKLLWVLGRS